MKWVFEQESINWDELSNLYRMAPLGDKKPDDLKVVFSNSMLNMSMTDHLKMDNVPVARKGGS